MSIYPPRRVTNQKRQPLQEIIGTERRSKFPAQDANPVENLVEGMSPSCMCFSHLPNIPRPSAEAIRIPQKGQEDS